MIQPMPYQNGAHSAEAWTDLVFHVLSFVETVPGDHSSLCSEGYRKWCRLQLSDGLQMACAESCQCLSALYRDAPRSHVLHMFPVLWDSIGGFVETEGTPFKRIAWTSPYRRRIAEHIGSCLQEPLIDRFRDSLRIAAEADFEVEWRRVMASKELAFAPVLSSNIQALSSSIPGLNEAIWAISLPLCRRGRLIGCRGTAPWICVGVPDSMLGVDVYHPVMQGCHEFLVWRELISCADWVQLDTVVGKEGYAGFMQVERRAISVGERILEKGPWRDSYRRWKQTIL